MANRKNWEHLPHAIEIGEHSSPEAVELANAINEGLAQITAQRRKCDEAAASLASLSVLADVDDIDNEAKVLRRIKIAALQAEIDLREKYAKWLEVNNRDAHAEYDRIQAELPAILETAKLKLRKAGFGRYVDLQFRDHFVNQEHQVRLNSVLYHYGPANDKLAQARHAKESAHGMISELGVNRNSLNAAKEQLQALLRSAAAVA